VWFLGQLREAERQITGRTEKSDAIMASQHTAALEDWEGRDPATAAFDHIVATCSQIGSKNADPVNAYLARGRRLAELGRFDEAKADFNKAAELATDDPQVLTARAVFYADHGQPDKAAAGFRDSLTLSKVGPKGAYWEGLPAYLEVAQRDDVLDRLESLRPEDGHPRMVRMVLSLHQGQLDAAGADAERLQHYGGQRGTSAAIALLRGDRQMFADLLANRGAMNPREQARLLTLAPVDASLVAELLKIAEENWTDPASRWHHRWLGEAQFRAGRFAEAIATLEGSLNPIFDWQCDGCYWPLLAMAHHRLGHFDAARKYLDKTSYLLELYQRMSPGQFAEVMGCAGANPRTWLDTVVYHREALQLIEGPAAAAALQQEGKFADAAAAWQGVVGVIPNDSAHWLQLAECRLRLGEFEAAVAACTRSADTAGNGPGKATALYRRGKLRMITRELAAALEDLNAALAIASADPPAPAVEAGAEQQRCIIWLLMGDLESHQRRCHELLDAYRDSQDATRLSMIVGCCRQHPASVDDWTEIVEIAERCVQLTPGSPRYRSDLFQVLCRAGRPDEALERVPEVASAEGLDSRLVLALCETQRGNIDRARKLLGECDARLTTEFSYWTAAQRRRADEIRQLIESAAPQTEPEAAKPADKGVEDP
jgi:tetratricopeptide (TPR) repeat protein